MSTDKLAVLTDVERRLATITTVDEAKDLRDKAEAVRRYAKSARLGLGVQNRAARVKIAAEQRAGLLLASILKRGRPGANANASTLKAFGIAPITSHRWQAEARIAVAEVDRLEAELTAAGEELTSAGIFRLGRAEVAAEPPAAIVQTPGWPDGPFRTLVIDPPWPIEKIVLSRRPIERETMDYATWSLERIREEVPVAALADDRGAHVYLWVTHKFLPVGLECFTHWGVRYECVLSWIKPTAQPLWWMYNAEHCLFGKVGALAPLLKGTPVAFHAPQQRHSHKPEAFFDLVRRVSPEPRLTVFDGAREGFVSWGVTHARALAR